MRVIKKYNILLSLIFPIIFFNCVPHPPLVTLVDNPLVPVIMPSPQYEITDFEVKKIKAVMDNEGRVHILAVSKSPKRLYYIVLDKELTPKSQLVNIKGKYANLDLAVDSKGGLHSIFDNVHFVLNNGKWKECSKCKCTRILRCGDYIACAFISEPKEIGRDWRIDWLGIFEPGPIFALPWFCFVDRLIIDRHLGSEWRDWTVIDPDTKLDITNNFSITADNSGALHVIYNRRRQDLLHDVNELAYTKIPPRDPLIDFSKDKVLKRLWTTSGKNIGELGPHSIIDDKVRSYFDAAVDPVTGNVLVIMTSKFYPHDYLSFIIIENNIGPRVPFLRGIWYESQLAVAGGGRFLALISSFNGYLWYLEHFNNKWSKPMKLGRVHNHLRDNFEILSDYNGNSMAIWINWDDSHLVAKLLELNK